MGVLLVYYLLQKLQRSCNCVVPSFVDETMDMMTGTCCATIGPPLRNTTAFSIPVPVQNCTIFEMKQHTD